VSSNPDGFAESQTFVATEVESWVAMKVWLFGFYGLFSGLDAAKSLWIPFQARLVVTLGRCPRAGKWSGDKKMANGTTEGTIKLKVSTICITKTLNAAGVQLVAMANERGGENNITVMIAL
jgi:hypothetical protein